jgi:hypothetical protein
VAGVVGLALHPERFYLHMLQPTHKIMVVQLSQERIAGTRSDSPALKNSPTELAQRLLQHSTLGLRAINDMKNNWLPCSSQLQQMGHRGTPLMRPPPPPHPRTTIGPYAYSYCRVLEGGGF